ncbi:MAG: tRNA (5-methylaminomethyl-2-thiouridine)(34)-methyltransferase MnmD [Granulosicoccus sp.]
MKVVKTGDGSPTLFSDKYSESFHSTFGAETESRYVFLKSSGVTARLEAGTPTKVLEIGFGLGLNTLLTCDTAARYGTSLEYHSFENDPSVCDLLQRVDYSPLLANPDLATKMKSQLKGADTLGRYLETGFPLSLASDQKVILHWVDAELSELPPTQFDAIYLDAFSPDNNPECWTAELFIKLLNSLRPTGKLSTYCAKGVVRRSLQSVGFEVAKMPGPPGKREIVVATRPHYAD